MASHEQPNDKPMQVKKKKRNEIVVGIALGVGGSILCFALMILYVNIAACRGADGIYFVNNTGRQLTIDVASNVEIVPSGQQRRLPPRDVDFSIQTKGGETWRYHMTPVDRRKHPNAEADKYSIIFQVESDGSVYLLYSKAQEPLKNLPPQPEGYPLRPQ